MSQQGAGPGGKRVGTASRFLLIGSALYFVDLFLQWRRICGEILGLGTRCFGLASGWEGLLGILNGVLVIAIIAMEVVTLANVNLDAATPVVQSQVEAGITWALLASTVIKVLLVDHEHRWWPAWAGIVLALVIAYGGLMRWYEATMLERSAPGPQAPQAPPPQPPALPPPPQPSAAPPQS